MAASEPIRVLCVDDDVRLCLALERLVGLEPRLEWKGHLTTIDGLAESLTRLSVDVLLLDLSMQGLRLGDFLASLRVSSPRVKTIIFSGHHYSERAQEAVDAGAAAFVSKSEDPDAVIEAILRIGSGAELADPSGH